MPGETTEAPKRPLSPQVRQVLTIVILGQLMALLDTTIVNVALKSLTVAMGTSIDTIQWVVTAYLLAFAAVTPLSGRAASRLGERRVYLSALTLFTVASLLCGLARSPGQMIAFRALQGIGGGLLVPVGQALLVRSAGPARIARVMSLLGVPTVLAPVFGPTAGGLLIDGAGWRWIFFVNLPLGVVAVALGRRMLPSASVEDGGSLDLPGVALVSGGMLALTYGLARVATAGHALSPRTVASLIVGPVLVAWFVARSRRIRHPLLSMHLYRNRVFAAAALSIFCVGALLYGGMILLPLYYQGPRHESAIVTGLLLAPAGIGAALASLVSGRLVGRIGSGSTVLLGSIVGVASTVPFGLLTSHTPFTLLSAVAAVRGAAIALMLMPSLVAAYKVLAPAEINMATPQLTALQRVGASLSTAVLSVVLQRLLTAHAGGPAAAAAAYAGTYRWLLAIAVVAVAPAALLTLREAAPSRLARGSRSGRPSSV